MSEVLTTIDATPMAAVLPPAPHAAPRGAPAAVESAIEIESLGKMYRLFSSPRDKVLDALGIARLMFWRRHWYREFWALRDLSLRIGRGERVGIVGRNGAGKSTLLKMIAGNVAPSEGRLRIRGKVQALMELGTGFHPEFSGRENIRASLAYQGLSMAEIREKEEEIIDFAELDEFIEQPLRTYSAGMYARLAFSTATAIEPEILIIDEILGAGDAYFTGKCVERMTRLTEATGATVLFVSHDLASVQRLCMRAVWIDRGTVRRDGECLEVVRAYSAEMRREEDLRLKARDMRVLKKQAARLESENLYDKFLLHLVPAAGTPISGKAKIYGLRLFSGDELLGDIAPGRAMDNSPDQLHALMDTPGLMDWGPPKRDSHGPYREYGNFGGRYGHAPFEFAAPKRHPIPREGLRVEIDYQTPAPVAVEAYDGDKYVRLAVLEGEGPRTARIAFRPARPDDEIEEGSPPAELLETKGSEARDTEYGEGGARLTAVRMYNSAGTETRVFVSGEPMRVEMAWEADQRLHNPVFVFCVYLPDGQCATQWIVGSRQMHREWIERSGRVLFDLDTLHLGRSAYVASAAIFKRLRTDGVEPESYHVLDRCIHFEVLQQDGAAVHRGLCHQPYRASIES